MALEGVRGLAALVVVLHHFLLAFFPMMTYGSVAAQHMRFEDNIHGTPLAVLFAGTFAVALFFVLSGFVLSIGFFQTKNESIIKKMATKRYIRLMLPALAAVLVCLILIKLGFAQRVAEVAAVTQSSWLGEQWRFDASLFHALYNGVIGIFATIGSPYDNVLWTMFIEFFGSFMVFGYVLLFGKSKHRWLGYILLGVLTFNSWFLPFVIGMAIADLYTEGKLEKFRRARWSVPFIGIGLVLGAYPTYAIEETAYSILNNPFLGTFITDFKIFYLTIAATLVILAVLLSKRIASLLEKPKISNLGKYTFALYLIHIPVLYSVVMVAFIAAQPFMSYNFAVLAALIVAIPSIWIATILFEKYVDAPSIQLAKYFSEVFEGEKSLGIRKYSLAFKRKIRRVARTLRRAPEIEEAPAE